jgi:hypothetical protein
MAVMLRQGGDELGDREAEQQQARTDAGHGARGGRAPRPASPNSIPTMTP